MAKNIDYILQECDCECDECGYSEYVEETNYGDINDELKDRGWIITKVDYEWHDFCCEECYNLFRKGHYNPRREI